MSARQDPLAGQEAIARTMWQRLTGLADEYNEPGRFTALIGYEWTSSPGGNNLHRNVIFRDSQDNANQIVPLSQYDTVDPEDLWTWMADYEANTGGRVLAVAHNGNLSNGLMFDDVTLTDQRPLDQDYAERRMRWEPLYEVTQMKGDGEAHPILSPTDEFADFETWDKANLGGPQPKTEDMLPREYAREAYKRGLAYEAQLGANPFKFGLIGFHRCPHVACDVPGRQFLRKGRGSGAVSGRGTVLRVDHGARTKFGRNGHQNVRLADERLGARRGLGAGEYAGGDLGRHGPQGGLRDQRHPDAGPGIRGLGLRGGGPRPVGFRRAWLRRRRADGRRPQ